MLTVLVVFFELVSILFFGIFARSDSTASTITSYARLVNNCFILLLAFTLMHAPFRKLSLFSLASLLITVTATIQTYMLFGTFWDSCFNGFNSTFTIDVTLITRSFHASLLVLLTALDFIGFFCYWQAYLILAPILTIGSSLCGAILLRGLKIFDGGSGMLVFLYSGVSSIVIWAILIRDKPYLNKISIKRSYYNQVLGVIGLIVAFINWPKFNAAGALTSQFNIDTANTVLAYLQNSAMTNTFLALSMSVLIAYFLSQKDDPEHQMKYDCTIDCFINGGISVASFQDIALNPSACLIIAALSSFLTLIIHKKYIKRHVEDNDNSFIRLYGRIVFRIVFSVLGVIICSIVVAARSGQTPALITGSYSTAAGLEIVGMLIVIVFAAIFSAIAAGLIKAFLGTKQPKQQNKDGQKVEKKVEDKKQQAQQEAFPYQLDIEDDQYFLNLNDQVCPLYYDIFGDIGKGIKQKQLKKADQTKIESKNEPIVDKKKQIRQELLKSALSQRQLEEIQKNTVKDERPPSPKLTIRSNFTRQNEKSVKKIVDLSTMKYQKYDPSDLPEENEPSRYQQQKFSKREDDDLPEMLGETRKPPMKKESKNVRFNQRQQYEKSSATNQFKEGKNRKGSEEMVDMRNKMLETRQGDALSGSEVRKGSSQFRSSQMNVRFTSSQAQ